MEDKRILDVAKALSDDLRIRIVEVLVAGKSRSYTDIMNDLGLDAIDDSSRFAYHIGVLTETGIVEKVRDGYQITKGGKEVFTAMSRVSKSWKGFAYYDSLKRLSGSDTIRLIWARTLLMASVFWLFFTPMLWLEGSHEIAFLMTTVGSISLLLGAYLSIRLRGNFGNDLWKVFLSVEHCAKVLGRNGIIVSLTSTLSSLGFIGLVLVVFAIGVGLLSIDLLAVSVILGSLVTLIISVYLSRKIAFLWESVSIGTQIPDYSGGMRLGYKLVIGVQIIISIIFIAFGASQVKVIGKGAFGYVGAGLGFLGSAVGTWMEYKKRATGLI